MRRVSSPRRAPGILGAFFLAALFILPSCRKEDAPPPWEGESVSSESDAEASKAQDTSSKVSPAESSPAKEPQADASPPLRFVAYNVENWLTMDRYVDRKPAGTIPKPQSERDAVVSILVDAQADILGICEIGTETDLADLQQQLKKAGLDYPHSHHTGGVDDTRHLALLSRFPIISTRVPDDLTYKLDDRTRGMGRGILDATVDTPKGAIRFLGVHLKSKREIPDGDQEMMRRAEAHLLRREADRILSDDPDTQLIVYGDMNDTRQASALRTIQGPRDGPKSLKMAYLRDSRGESWTHHWSYQDVYSRLDYILVSTPMVQKIDWDESRVLDNENWAEASDHRALLLIIK
ncbi:endonuclease/exonuclease/phosphatase family protein [Haloferula sp.]|uniref:endonuclease/exonuclease/phosphatase family protein n=1 Tax=Haloferula sp. TaxID=2497595 RepID=UPI003C718DD4